MMKQLAITISLAIFSVSTFAQAYEGKVKYGKTEEPAIVMVYDYPEQIVENAFLARLTDNQLTGDKSKDFYLYPNCVIKEISSSKLDFLFKLEETGQKGQEKTTIYMIMRGSGNIEGAEQLAGRGKAFLEEMLPYIKRSHTITQIKKQEEILVDEEKALLDLQKEQNELETQLEKNKTQQEARQKIIASQKMILADLKARQN